MTNYGMKVTQQIRWTETDEVVQQVLRNVTEVHYHYPTVGSDPRVRVAFESDIHSTGITYAVAGEGELLELIEFEVRPDTEIADEF